MHCYTPNQLVWWFSMPKGFTIGQHIQREIIHWAISGPKQSLPKRQLIFFRAKQQKSGLFCQVCAATHWLQGETLETFPDWTVVPENRIGWINSEKIDVWIIMLLIVWIIWNDRLNPSHTFSPSYRNHCVLQTKSKHQTWRHLSDLDINCKIFLRLWNC